MALPALLTSHDSSVHSVNSVEVPTPKEALQSHNRHSIASKEPGVQTDSYAKAWEQAVAKFGSSIALIYDGKGPEVQVSYCDLERGANRLARNLQSCYGIEKGDLIVIVAENRPELVTLLLSCIKIGAAFVPLATDLRIQDCHKMVSMYNPSLIVCDQPMFMPFSQVNGKDYRTLLIPHFHDGQNILKAMELEGDGSEFHCASVSDDPCVIFSTSGSTGLPKGVVHTAEAMGRLGMMQMKADANHAFTGNPGSKYLFWVPMRGALAIWTLLSTTLRGQQHVMVDTYPSGPMQWAALLDKHKITDIMLFGAAMNEFTREMPSRKFASVQNVGYGGSCCPVSLIQRSMKQFPHANFQQCYGMTETGLISVLRPAHHKCSECASAEDLEIMASAGKVCSLPLIQAFVEDADMPGSGMPPPPEKNGVGQICVWTPFIMQGYFKNPEKTKEAIPDGFMRTGDLGRICKDGFIHILGRVKDIIPTYRGFNVAPRDIEEVLYLHPGVGQAAAVGVLHPCGAGEMVVAWVTCKMGSNLCAIDMQQHCKAAGLPSWQMPELFNVSTESLPTVGNKISKRALQEPQMILRSLVQGLSTQHSNEDDTSMEWVPEAKEMFSRLDVEGTGAIELDRLQVVFGTSADIFLQSFWHQSACFNDILLEDWISRLRSMPQSLRKSWLLQFGSVLAIAAKRA